VATEREQYPSARGLTGEARQRWAIRRGLAIARIPFTEADVDLALAANRRQQTEALREQIKRMEGK
jgi:hypothetical protein